MTPDPLDSAALLQKGLELTDHERDVLIMALRMWLDDAYKVDDARAGDPDVEAVTAILLRLGVTYERP